jgi:hypothetical protein
VEVLVLFVLGCGLPGATESAAGMGEPSLQAVGALGHTWWHRQPGTMAVAAGTEDQACVQLESWCLLARCWLPGTTAAAAGMEEPSLQAARVLELACQVPASKSHGSCCRHRGSKPVASGSSRACLLGAIVQEPQELLQSQENKAFGQWKPRGLLTGTGFWECSAATAAGTGNQACWLVPSVNCRAVGALGPAYTWVLISLVFQGKGSRLCSRGEHGALSSCVCQEAGLTTQQALNNGV